MPKIRAKTAVALVLSALHKSKNDVRISIFTSQLRSCTQFAQSRGRSRPTHSALVGDTQWRPPPFFTHLPHHSVGRLLAFSHRFFCPFIGGRVVESIFFAQHPVFRARHPLPQSPRVERTRLAARLGNDHRANAFGTCIFGVLHRRQMACRHQDQSIIHRLHLHRRCLHLPLGASILRLRNSGKSPTSQLRQRLVVGVDECHHGRCSDLCRHHHRQDHHRAAANLGYDDVSDLHHLYFQAIHPQKRVRRITPDSSRSSYEGLYPTSFALSAGRESHPTAPLLWRAQEQRQVPVRASSSAYSST